MSYIFGTYPYLSSMRSTPGVLGSRQEAHTEKALPFSELEHQLLQGIKVD
jgi:hypothetical protein